MSRDDEAMQRELRDALAARDRSNPAPVFALEPRERSIERRFAWRAAFASIASAAVIAAGLSWWAGHRPESATERFASGRSIDAGLARELSSSSSYWKVPTDQLLAYAPDPMGFELPAPGLQVSLEESLL